MKGRREGEASEKQEARKRKQAARSRKQEEARRETLLLKKYAPADREE